MSEFRGIVRIFGTDVPGDKKVKLALTRVRGIGLNLAHSIANIVGVSPEEKMGNLDEKKVLKIEEVIENPQKYKVPPWLLNRRKDYGTGESRHVVGANLIMALREDINQLRKIRSYRGIRHELGLPVRGQRTKSSFRKGTVVGVRKKKR